MVCPICITTAIVSQLPVISAAVVSATGVKLAIDQRRSPGATVKELKDAQKVTLMKAKPSQRLWTERRN
ncbi:g11391 [Coccomyxa elongata]